MDSSLRQDSPDVLVAESALGEKIDRDQHA